MNSVSYLHGWKPELCLPLNTEGGNLLTDFNRFLVKHFPATEKLQNSSQFEDANREGFILQIKDTFSEKIAETSDRNHRNTQS